jgi:hypothetical protein
VQRLDHPLGFQDFCRICFKCFLGFYFFFEELLWGPKTAAEYVF